MSDNDRLKVYWIKCDRDFQPKKYEFSSMGDMLRIIEQLQIQRGPIEFMIRES